MSGAFGAVDKYWMNEPVRSGPECSIGLPLGYGPLYGDITETPSQGRLNWKQFPQIHLNLVLYPWEDDRLE